MALGQLPLNNIMVRLMLGHPLETAYLKIHISDLKSELPIYSKKQRGNCIALQQEHSEEHSLLVTICFNQG